MKDKDWYLVLKAQHGNARAFGKLVKQYQDKILYLAYDLLENYNDAQEVAQRAFIRAYKSINSFKGQSKFSTWLYRIVVNLSIDFKRAKSRRHQISMNKLPDEDSDQLLKTELKDQKKRPDELLELKEFNIHLKKSLRKLPHHQRVAFILRHYHDMSMKEIANILGCKDGTVRSHLFRALNKLREDLKEFDTL